MGKITCNLNSYGNIDYGKPVNHFLNDYRTSSGHYHRRLAEITSNYFRVEPRIAANSLIKDNKLSLEYSKTCQSDYGPKYQKPKGNDVYKKSGRCNKVQYMISVKEKMFKNPTRPVDYPISEYNYQFVPKQPIIGEEVIPPSSYCRLQSMGFDEQPRVQIECATGVAKLMDPYVTCTRLTHIPFTPDQIYRSSADRIPTCYNAKKDLPMTTTKEPVFDKVVFNNGVRDRIKLPLICRVPHVGCKTEYSSSYVSPETSELFPDIHYDGAFYSEALNGPNQIQTMSAPGMYCTEGCHTGTGWPVTAVVNRQKDDKLHVHKHEIPCYTEIV